MRYAIILAQDESLIAELSGTTEQQTPTGHVRYYSPDGREHKTDMLRAVMATIGRLQDVDSFESVSEWISEVEFI